ncbi:hypothetical protein BDZ94DRAFT_1261903 [Collybia nuda]|uniref:LCCL domain-containing protein n=1 Tax=Collybia nuda TaxID=64659 RepID=A0A9P5Y6K3_9AGAR|nr:hypothetical protein BDZ94DRAFT_1261903 [Collybia nuda]
MLEASSSSSSGSSHLADKNLSLRDRKPSFDQNIQLEELQAIDSEAALTTTVPSTYGHSTWHARMRSRLTSYLVSKHPRSTMKIGRIFSYLRGPRPKIDLPEPMPWLDINIRTRWGQFTLPLESLSSRLTRLFASPSLLVILGVTYIIGLAFFSRAQSFITPASSSIGCTATYWLPNDGCGLDGGLCLPFIDSLFEFRCPAQCKSVILQNPRTVGDQQVVFTPLVVGGGDANRTYRGDSFICAAALQAGLISNNRGGCAALELIGNFSSFVPLTANGLSSIAFPTTFPLSFRFLPSTSLTHCEDRRDSALAFNVLVTWILFVILRPRPIIFYWCLVCIGFWHITLFSQPRASPPPLGDAFGTFLPTLFISYVFWRLAFRFTLPSFSHIALEGSVWYLAPFWAGILTNLTTDKIPIDRLTASDLSKRSGAIAALIIIIIIVAIMVFNQVRVIRTTGWLPHYAGWYVLGGLVTLVISLLPGLELRLHHYILSMILIPGTGFPTRLSAIYQGFLLGMFLNGGAAFGFDSILQTAAELRQDGPLGSILPTFLTNSTTFNASIPLVDQLISWDILPEGWDGFALLVDDVERYTGTALNFSLAAFDPNIPHFFRLAFTSGANTGDFTMPAALWPNGSWINPLPGPS